MLSDGDCRIATTLESQFPEMAGTQPAPFASTVPTRSSEKAVGYGYGFLPVSRQSGRSAATKTVSQLQKGSCLLVSLPSPQRTREVLQDPSRVVATVHARRCEGKLVNPRAVGSHVHSWDRHVRWISSGPSSF